MTKYSFELKSKIIHEPLESNGDYCYLVELLETSKFSKAIFMYWQKVWLPCSGTLN